MRIGYARVSTDDQNLDLQKDALRQARVEKCYEDMAWE
jgi:DNA invertase Pin-like site-specific DNA recombinase